MKNTVNMNDLRRMRQSFDLGHTIERTSARVQITPAVVAQWFETFRGTGAAPVSPAAAPETPATEPEKPKGRMKRVL